MALVILRNFDPFLLLDDFRNDVPEDYLAGFPWHPHRGIETITYVLAGTVEHGDSLGNRGAIASGDVQWMTAGSGIIHQEMPKGDHAGRMHGFQLWANLPSSLKMTAPRYQEVQSPDIPEVTDDEEPTRVSSAGISGEPKAPSMGSLPTRFISTYPSLRAKEKFCRWKPLAMRSRMFLREQGSSATPLIPSLYRRSQSVGRIPTRHPKRITARWCCSIAVTR